MRNDGCFRKKMERLVEGTLVVKRKWKDCVNEKQKTPGIEEEEDTQDST